MFNRFFSLTLPAARVREPIEYPTAPSSPGPSRFARAGFASPGKATRGVACGYAVPFSDPAPHLARVKRPEPMLRAPRVETPRQAGGSTCSSPIPTSHLLFEVALRLAALERDQ